MTQNLWSNRKKKGGGSKDYMSDSDPDNDIPKAVGLLRKSKALSETALYNIMNPKAQTPSNSQKSKKSQKSPNSEKSKNSASKVFRNSDSDSESESQKALLRKKRKKPTVTVMTMARTGMVLYMDLMKIMMNEDMIFL